MSRTQRKPLEFFLFYWRDFNRDAAHLSRAQRDGYLQAICAYYDNFGPLHENTIMKASGATPAEWLTERDVLAAFFRVDTAGVWHHKRIDATLAKTAATTEKKMRTRRKRRKDSGLPLVPTSKRTGRPRGRDWSALRESIFERDGWTCAYCGTATDAPHCDHVAPLSRGGGNEAANLATACPTCNRAKHDKTVAEWRAGQ